MRPSSSHPPASWNTSASPCHFTSLFFQSQFARECPCTQQLTASYCSLESYSLSVAPSSTSSIHNPFVRPPLIATFFSYPSPTSFLYLRFLYFISCSLLPKFDELSALCSLYAPHIIAVTLAHYHPFRFDHNRHGGGAIVYVNSSIPCSMIILPSTLN